MCFNITHVHGTLIMRVKVHKGACHKKKPKDTYDILFFHISCNQSNIDRFKDIEKTTETPIFLP